MSQANNSDLIALIPALTPHQSFSVGGVFHPLTLLLGYKPGFLVDEKSTYSGYSGMHLGSMASNTVVVTVPGTNSVWKTVLKKLAEDFVNADNILAEAEILELDDHNPIATTIAYQVQRTFAAYPGAKRIMLIWPYQMMSVKTPILGTGAMDYTFTHHNLNVMRKLVPECLVLAAEDDGQEAEMVCKGVVSYEDVDDLLKPMYRRVLSSVEIPRDMFEYYANTQDFPNMQKLVQQLIVGKRGVVMNHKDFAFL